MAGRRWGEAGSTIPALSGAPSSGEETVDSSVSECIMARLHPGRAVDSAGAPGTVFA